MLAQVIRSLANARDWQKLRFCCLSLLLAQVLGSSSFLSSLLRFLWSGSTPQNSSSGRLSPRALVRVRSRHRCLYTPRLSSWSSSSALTRFNPVRELISKLASHLDAFSGYPSRTWLPSYALGSTTGSPSVRPPRSSRTRGRSPQFPYAHSG